MKTKKSARLAILFVVLALAFLAYYHNTGKADSRCKGFALCEKGKVERVIDGDTLVVANKTIRLALVNAPERNEEAGKGAKNFTATLCKIGSAALVDEDDWQTKGSYGRIVAIVYCNGKNLNELLLENGFGEIYTSFCKGSEFGNEKWAKKYGC